MTCILLRKLWARQKRDFWADYFSEKRLHDPAEKYLPKFTPQIMSASADGRHVRLQRPSYPPIMRLLLTHQSGLPFRSSLETPTLDRFPLALRVESYALEPLMFEPGSDAVYSNAGVNTAARVIEVVSGMAFEDFLQQRLFDPLGMKDTTFWPILQGLKDMVVRMRRT